MIDSLRIHSINLGKSHHSLRHLVECCRGDLILVQEPPHVHGQNGSVRIAPEEGFEAFGWGRARILCPTHLAKTVTVTHISDCLVSILIPLQGGESRRGFLLLS